MEVKIYVANLERYNAGYLVGEWVELPKDQDELQEILQRISKGAEIAIHDYSIEGVEGLRIGEYDNIQELNAEIDALYYANDYIQELALAIVEAHGETITGAIGYAEHGDYTLYPECTTAQELGEYFADIDFTLPQEVARYFDFEAYGEDVANDGYFTSYGFLMG